MTYVLAVLAKNTRNVAVNKFYKQVQKCLRLLRPLTTVKPANNI